MSVRVMSWVFEHSNSTGNDRLVLLAIADRCDDDGGNCWKSTEKLAEKARVSKRTAQRCIDHLVELGELEVVERPGTTNMLAVVMEGRQVDAPSADGKEPGGVRLSPLTTVTPRQVVTGDTRVQGGVTTVSTDTSLNHPTTPQPPASGGHQRKRAHCLKHSRHNPKCTECVRQQERDDRQATWPPWCGCCDENTRKLADELLTRCPDCHPLRRSA